MTRAGKNTRKDDLRIGEPFWMSLPGGKVNYRADAGQAGDQRAHAADDHADLDPGLAGGIQPANHALIDQIIDLQGDASR